MYVLTYWIISIVARRYRWNSILKGSKLGTYLRTADTILLQKYMLKKNNNQDSNFLQRN